MAFNQRRPMRHLVTAPGLLAVIALGTAGVAIAEPVAAETLVHHKANLPVVVSCKGKWSYSGNKVHATVIGHGPAFVRFTVTEAGAKSVSVDAQIRAGGTTASKTLRLAKPPKLIIGTVIEENSKGTPKGIDATCDLTPTGR
jgi:hypothetical protein